MGSDSGSTEAGRGGGRLTETLSPVFTTTLAFAAQRSSCTWPSVMSRCIRERERSASDDTRKISSRCPFASGVTVKTCGSTAQAPAFRRPRSADGCGVWVVLRASQISMTTLSGASKREMNCDVERRSNTMPLGSPRYISTTKRDTA